MKHLLKQKNKLNSVKIRVYCYKQIFIPYLFLIFLYLLLCLHPCLCHYAYAIYPYLILYISCPFFISDQTLSIHYLSIPFPQPFSRFDQIKTLSIIPSHFLSSLCFHSILSSSLSYYHLTLPDSKGCTSLSPYSHYLCLTQPQPSSISRRPVCIISLSFNLI